MIRNSDKLLKSYSLIEKSKQLQLGEFGSHVALLILIN